MSQNAEDKKEATKKPIHHNWLFWVGVVLMVIAIFIYVSTLDLRM